MKNGRLRTPDESDPLHSRSNPAIVMHQLTITGELDFIASTGNDDEMIVAERIPNYARKPIDKNRKCYAFSNDCMGGGSVYYMTYQEKIAKKREKSH